MSNDQQTMLEGSCVFQVKQFAMSLWLSNILGGFCEDALSVKKDVKSGSDLDLKTSFLGIILPSWSKFPEIQELKSKKFWSL